MSVAVAHGSSLTPRLRPGFFLNTSLTEGAWRYRNAATFSASSSEHGSSSSDEHSSDEDVSPCSTGESHCSSLASLPEPEASILHKGVSKGGTNWRPWSDPLQTIKESARMPGRARAHTVGGCITAIRVEITKTDAAR